MFMQKPLHPQLPRLPDSFRRLELYCDGKRKPGHIFARSKFSGFAPSGRFGLAVAPQMVAQYTCAVCGAREFYGADFRTNQARRLGSI
ncbi:MAG: hypothetical protein JWQ90_3415 [Hydrocarboniphaga sp.]|nr:hypothetical protein [Hydrocarboniphaga sp.]